MMCRVGIIAALLTLAGSAGAQSRPTSKPDYERAVRAWLSSAEPVETERRRAVEQTLEGGKSALRFVGREIETLLSKQNSPRKRIEQLIVGIAIGFHDRQRNSGMFYAGQYEPLEPLLPYIGEVYLQLLIETPDWYPLQLRASLVPALRDLYPDGPSQARRSDLYEIATDEEQEGALLRHALACAFAQWGSDQLIEPRMTELLDSVGDRKTENELYVSRQLALLHYNLRDYRAAADEWILFLRGREAIDLPAVPLDYYNAACSLGLAGRIPAALAELERCADQLVSDSLDESHRIERKLFEQDPELRAVRPTEQFSAIVKRVFGEAR